MHNIICKKNAPKHATYLFICFCGQLSLKCTLSFHDPLAFSKVQNFFAKKKKTNK